ncbi:MAG: MFS transporter [Inquilinus sp.]|nr:MFS transporter [Inquilinus sp.]
MHVLTGLYLTIVIGLVDLWQMPYDTMIRVWTIGSLMVGVGAPLAGWLGDRWSASRMMIVFFLVTGFGSVAAGLVDGPAALGIALAVLGIGASIYHPVGFSWVVRHAEKRGQTMGIVGIFGSLGVAGAALVAGVLTETIGWRAAFIVPGVLSAVAGLALWSVVWRGRVRDRSADRMPEPAPVRGELVRTFLVLTVTMISGGLIFNALQVAMPKLFDERMVGLTGGALLGVGGLVTAVYLVGALSQLAGGYLSDRLPLRTVYIGGLVLHVPLLALLAGLFDLPLLVAATVTIFVGGALLPAENLLLARYTPGRHRGFAFGLKFVLAFGVAPLSVELVAFAYRLGGGFGALLWILAATGLVACIAALLLPRAVPPPAPAVAAVAAE